MQCLALDPFLQYLVNQLPSDTMIRAYADDMAVIIKNIHSLKPLSEAFQLLRAAASLQVNVGKTVCVPLYQTTSLQCGKDISNTLWGGMEVQIGYGKYLGFLVGPYATAEVNFQPVMEKFRARVGHWLQLAHMGNHFQVLGYNMFATSVFNFISQLYALPPAFQKECNELALKFMHGPRFWLHGARGHAFFRAGVEIGFPACPRCIESTGLQISFSSLSKHIPDLGIRLLS